MLRPLVRASAYWSICALMIAAAGVTVSNAQAPRKVVASHSTGKIRRHLRFLSIAECSLA